ncbi:MerR family transcriptional regulator [Leifsonia sp. Root4]|uniref:MerR family transcriptional regulator n=1 Tax=Leifsonia sp. Root4 TaxID=1736525 RepID=UPI0006F7C3B9|nr:TipAS antibiotic-recognition domain-containing protein [Leifsonia sp. Root4]KQW08321.1 MerR family transcriptional regulator [Leifsonia sp. Root4]
MHWSIQEIAKLAGTTSRTLRHYDETGLLRPSSIGSNGYRHYDEAALVRLQRILLLRQLGLGLPAIADVLDNERDERHALHGHLDWLRQEQDRLARQIASVELTIETLEGGEQLMAENMFDGFDHTQYKEEVEQRWGADAYAKSDAWWRSMTAEQKAGWQERQRQLAADWSAAATSGVAADSAEAQALARRHVEWLRGIPGTPGGGTTGGASGPPKAYLLGLAEMYVADERFGANYGGQSGAEFVRDALTVFAEREL